MAYGWFKIHHGFIASAKLGLSAKDAQTTKPIILAISLEILKYASSNSTRGSIAGIDPEEIAFTLEIDTVTVRNALLALRNRGFIEHEIVTNWEEYQGRSDSTNTDRQQRFRNKKKQDVTENVTEVTVRNALRNTDKTRLDKTIKKESPKKKTSMDYSLEFESWWKEYPNHSGSKSDAYKSYQKSIDITVNHQILIAAVQKFKTHQKKLGTEPRFIPHATTWLNQRRWEADYSTPERAQQHENKNWFA